MCCVWFCLLHLMHFIICPCTVAPLCCSVAFFMYRRCSNYASFLILCQNATFQTSNFQWCVTLRKLIFYSCITITQISWLRKWTVIIACHRWYIKLRHIRDMAETSLEKKQQRYKRTRKQTWPIRFKHGNAVEICNGMMFNFYPGLLHFIQSTTLLAWFPHYQKRSILRELLKKFAILIFACLRYTLPCYRIAFVGVF